MDALLPKEPYFQPHELMRLPMKPVIFLGMPLMPELLPLVLLVMVSPKEEVHAKDVSPLILRSNQGEECISSTMVSENRVQHEWRRMVDSTGGRTQLNFQLFLPCSLSQSDVETT